MMQQMIDYTTAVLEAIGAWLGTEPILYIFGLICAAFVFNMIKSLMTR